MPTRYDLSPAGLAHELRPSVMRLARRLRQMRDDSVDLNSNQLSAMSVLLNSGDQLMGELAAAEKVQPPSMTRIVNGLEERGFVTRRAQPGDRRQCLVTLTERRSQGAARQPAATRRVAGGADRRTRPR